MGTKCILRGNEMHFVGSKSLYVSLCPLPGSVVLQSDIRNLLSAFYFDFNLFHASPKLGIFIQYILFASSNIGPFILEKQKDS